MDRRRRKFIPSGEGLEDRQLMATSTSVVNPFATTTTTDPLGARTLRIERLPRYFASIQTHRFLPLATINQIENDLRPLVGQLHVPSNNAKTFFELTLRGVINNATLSRNDVLALNHAFGVVLTSAGATDAQVARLQGDMLAMAATDAADVNPTKLATNDFAIVLQTAMAVGRPIKAPKAPKLVVTDDTGKKGDFTTAITQPRLTGTYDAGTSIVIIDTAGNFLGSTTVPSTGIYAVQFAKPLSVGAHTVAVFATSGDVVSPLSPTITLNIEPKLTR